MKKSHLIGIVMIAIAFGIIISTVSNTGTYATFAEAEAHPGKVFHVVGQLAPGRPMIYNPEWKADLFVFYMVDNQGKECKVMLNKARPQDFEKSEQVVVIGKMKEGVFIASDVLMKCPSKYNGSQMQSQALQ
jgi:cytochrome c-type biogenesis protein CcmE